MLCVYLMQVISQTTEQVSGLTFDELRESVLAAFGNT